MDDEYDYTDPTMAAREMAALRAQYATAQTQEQEARRRMQQQREMQFKQAQDAIRQSRMGAPSRAQELFALSQAFLSPKPYKGFAGTLANVVPALGQIAGAKGGAEEDRQQMLMRLQQQYDDKQAESQLQGLTGQREDLLDMMKFYAPMLKPQKPNNDFNPVTGALQSKDTGEEIVPLSAVPPAAVQQLRDYIANPANTPENKRAAAANFQQRFGVPAARVLQGGM